MNKDNYKKAFSGVRPSDETVERIFEMSENKNRKFRHKGLIIAIACLTALLCGTLTANAATDGALFEGLTLILNGEEVNLMDYLKDHKSYVNEDGKEVQEYVFDIPDENGEASMEIAEQVVSDGDNIEDVGDSNEQNVPATSKSTEE